MIKRILRNWLWRIQRWVRKKNFGYALKEAQTLADETGRTMLICFIKGEYKVYSKQFLRNIRNSKGYFRGMSNADLENMADFKIYKYVTPKRQQAC